MQYLINRPCVSFGKSIKIKQSSQFTEANCCQKRRLLNLSLRGQHQERIHEEY